MMNRKRMQKTLESLDEDEPKINFYNYLFTGAIFLAVTALIAGYHLNAKYNLAEKALELIGNTSSNNIPPQLKNQGFYR
jgi:hypothetical protein